VDSSSVSLGYTDASFSDADVGTSKTVTVNGLSLSGSAAADYALPTVPVTTEADITP
jgi:hypothetical protein